MLTLHNNTKLPKLQPKISFKIRHVDNDETCQLLRDANPLKIQLFIVTW
jgi:hypothetical protein